MKDKRLWILLGGALLIGVVFLLLDFRVAASSTQANQTIITTELEGNYPDRLQPTDTISMVLAGEGPLVRALQKSLTEQIDKAGMGQIELAGELEPAPQNPALVVKVGKPGSIWTPFFAMSQFSVHAGYASDGDSTFMEGVEETHTSVAKKDVSNMYAEFEVNDRALGLISRPGYHQFLADYLAQEIVATLQDLYHVQKTFLP